LVGGGAANTVMDVDDGEHDTQLLAFFEQPAQQGHGVGASGDRYSNPLTGTKKTASKCWRLHRCAYVRAITG
jgi:hypothetical protein